MAELLAVVACDTRITAFEVLEDALLPLDTLLTVDVAVVAAVVLDVEDGMEVVVSFAISCARPPRWREGASGATRLRSLSAHQSMNITY